MAIQNKSHAVMAQRSEAKDSLDNFPTPPWATRALLEYIVGEKENLNSMASLEPACGAGHMSKVLAEYFGRVESSDVYPYGYGKVTDFLSTEFGPDSFDWVITNPPFRLAEEFILHSLPIAKKGVAVLVRTVFLESVGRYEGLFSPHPPSKVAQFVERVPMVKGRLDKKASTATGYAWVIWERQAIGKTKLLWVPPCRKKLERDQDYFEPTSSLTVGVEAVEKLPKKEGLLI